MAGPTFPLFPENTDPFDLVGSAIQQAGQAEQEGLTGAIQQLMQAGQQDEAPSMDSPFPQGGLKGALFGLFAGAGGILPQVTQQMQQAKAQNIRQQGFLKLRQADRQKQISGLETERAGIDSRTALRLAELELSQAKDEESKDRWQKEFNLRLKAAQAEDKDTYKLWSSSPYFEAVNANLSQLMAGVNQDGSPITPEQFGAIEQEMLLGMRLGRAPADFTMTVLEQLREKDKSLFKAYQKQFIEQEEVQKKTVELTSEMGDRLFGEDTGPETDRIGDMLGLIDNYIGLDPEAEEEASIFSGLHPREAALLRSLPTPYDIGPIPTRGPFSGRQ